jgi:hypothetical protein
MHRRGREGSTVRIVFPYIAQFHQIPHSLPIAIEIARRYPAVEVHIAYPGSRYLPFIRRLVSEYAPDVPLRYDRLRLDPFNRLRVMQDRVPWKQAALLANRRYFGGFDAIVTPERTSLFLRRVGVSRPRMIWTRHGAGDREVGFSSNVSQFDFVLMAGRRIEQRLLNQKLIRPGDYKTGVYAKFDWLQPGRQPSPPLFGNERPTVLYNPHFASGLSSWPRFGMRVLEQFAQSERYNLIFAPHVRLFDPARPAHYRAFRRFLGLPHMRIDLGSERSVDMSYTRAADLYLGDVSSQVAEFLHMPRPCLFLNAHQASWRSDPNYAFWHLGRVTDDLADLEAQIDRAFAEYEHYREAQRRYFAESFELPAQGCSAVPAADAIVQYLERTRRSAERQSGILAMPGRG